MWQKSLLSVVRGTLSSWFDKTIQEFEPVGSLMTLYFVFACVPMSSKIFWLSPLQNLPDFHREVSHTQSAIVATCPTDRKLIARCG